VSDKHSIAQVRLAPEDRDRVKAAAKRERRTVSAWLRALVLDTGRQRLRRTRLPNPCCISIIGYVVIDVVLPA